MTDHNTGLHEKGQPHDPSMCEHCAAIRGDTSKMVLPERGLKTPCFTGGPADEPQTTADNTQRRESAVQPPSVGRIVHFSTNGGGCRAAIITAVHTNQHAGTVNLTVFGAGMFDATPMLAPIPNVLQDESRDTPYTWHWPERV